MHNVEPMRKGGNKSRRQDRTRSKAAKNLAQTRKMQRAQKGR